MQTGLLINSPENPTQEKRVFENNSRLQFDSHILRQTPMGVLASFVRFQADYDPDIFPDFQQGINLEDASVGVEASKLSLYNKDFELSFGRLENASTRFLTDGFTDRGSQSLDGRTGDGIGVAKTFLGVDFNATLLAASRTTRARTSRPNISIGLKRDFGDISLALGASYLSIDNFSAVSNLPLFVQNSALFAPADKPTTGFAVAGEVALKALQNRVYLGFTYASGTSEDALFAFLDGVDSFSVHFGGRYHFTKNLTFNLDAAYITALSNGFRNKNGFLAAANIEWLFRDNWSILGEIGYSSVERFGHDGERFFNIGATNSPDFLLQLRHRFVLPHLDDIKELLLR